MIQFATCSPFSAEEGMILTGVMKKMRLIRDYLSEWITILLEHWNHLGYFKTTSSAASLGDFGLWVWAAAWASRFKKQANEQTNI